MTEIFRVVTEWSGFNGAPGYTNMFFRNYLPGGAPTNVDDRISAIGAAERVTAFWEALRGQFPDDVTLTVQSAVDVIEDTTGALVDSLSIDTILPIRGIQSGGYSAAAGGVIGWQTGTVRNRRRIRGQTFLVPLASNSFNTQGRIYDVDVDVLRAAATALAIGGVNSTFGVWARPVVKTEKNPDVVERPGQWAECTGIKVTSLGAVLRSRRD